MDWWSYEKPATVAIPRPKTGDHRMTMMLATLRNTGPLLQLCSITMFSLTSQGFLKLDKAILSVGPMFVMDRLRF